MSTKGMLVKIFLPPLFSKDGIEVKTKSLGRGGLYTSERIGGINVYLEWDNEYKIHYEDKVKCNGFRHWVIEKDGWKYRFPKKEASRMEVYAARHLFTLLDFCEDRGIEFHNISGTYLEKIVEKAWEKELHETMKEEYKNRYLERLSKRLFT